MHMLCFKLSRYRQLRETKIRQSQAFSKVLRIGLMDCFSLCVLYSFILLPSLLCFLLCPALSCLHFFLVSVALIGCCYFTCAYLLCLFPFCHVFYCMLCFALFVVLSSVLSPLILDFFHLALYFSPVSLVLSIFHCPHAPYPLLWLPLPLLFHFSLIYSSCQLP